MHNDDALRERQRERATLARRKRWADAYFATPAGQKHIADCAWFSARQRAALAQHEASVPAASGGEGLETHPGDDGARARALRIEERACGTLGELVALGRARGVEEEYAWAARVWRNYK